MQSVYATVPADWAREVKCQKMQMEKDDTHKLLWDFDIHTDHLILARRPDLTIISKKKKRRKICKIVDFDVPADHRIKLKECEKKDKNIDLDRELKKKNYGTCR